MFSRIASLGFLIGSVAAKILYAGVNESGGEFGVYSNPAVKGTGLPGVFGVDYAFINETTVDYYVDHNGVNLFRVAFLLERMCPLEFGLGNKFDEVYFQHFYDAVQYITTHKRRYAMLDPHNYMRYNDPSQQPFTGSVIGNSSDPTAATTAQFKAFWTELAHRFRHNSRVIFGLMNEPHDMPTSLVFDNDQAAIDGIRSTGAAQLIVAPGNSWTGGHSWTQSYPGYDSNADYMYKLKDPLNNLAMDVHEYLDVDFSGGHSECVSSGPDYLKDLTAWLKQHKLKAILSEFGGSAKPSCASMVPELLQYLADNPEWIGWTAWAAGPLWGQYSPCCEDYGTQGSLEPGSKAGDGSAGMYDTVWVPYIQPFVPKHLGTHGISSVSGPTS